MSRKLPVVLIPAPMTEQVLTECAALFDVIRLWEEADPEGTLRERGPEVRAIASAGARVDAELMRRLPGLEIVSGFGVGYDFVDLDEARARGVVVTNTPDVLTDDVADIAIALVLMVVRELPQAERHLRAGRWPEGRYRNTPTRLKGRRLGILGLGRIGRAVAERAAGFGVEIAYHSRQPLEVEHAYFSSVTELADHVDTLVVTTPGGAETHHLVDADVLQRLGSRGILVNVARGSVVDTDALVSALENGTILGAGLDVYEDEPQVPEALLRLPNAVLLPHVGSASADTFRDIGRLLVDNLSAWFTHRAVLTPVPETPAPLREEASCDA